ncbi:MAG: hypothetical protein IPM34_00290 [Saprospiraceae bacterium]|nr:hypothetical protein [Saprospiraceae bacterium]
MNLKFSPSFISFLLLTALLVFSNFNIARWNGLRVIDWDVVGFYAYLPATFIHHDYKLGFVKERPEYAAEKKFWPHTAPNGGMVIKPTMGLSLLYLPFFFLAHLHSQIADLEADGFSILYHKYIHLSALFYLIIGFYFLRQLLLKWFSEWAVVFSLVSIALGTNLFYYSTTEASMSHAYTFALSCLFLYAVVRWYETYQLRFVMQAGFILGMMILIRPVNILFGLFPLLYGIPALSALKERIHFFWMHKKQILLFIIFVFLPLIPQLLYWKSVTGQFVFYSYFDEHFFFLKPEIFKGLFSFRNGWLIYTPMMIFSIVGLYFVKSKHKELLFPIRFLFITYIYIVFSWWCWWYVGFSNRAMIDVYAFLSIPLAVYYEQLLAFRKTLKFMAFIVAFFFLCLNLFQTLQYRHGLVHFDSMNFKAYKSSFGTLKYNDAYKQALQSPDYDKAKLGKE